MPGRKVLVVDDDDDIREITGVALELMGGWSVVDTDRGATAVRLAVEEQPDLVLLDVMMPDLDGPGTFRLLQQDPRTRDIPVILLTAKVQVGEGRLWDDLAVAGVISKPFDPMGLVEQIDRLLERHRSAARSRLSA
ncbi:response regulator [Nocardioides caldifontis]|uniref:response regulator n=1 Tax=Nocardioides caldifontis TaxID=2588938 RepID=UPI0011DF57CC|nr:response regulator [Nocardioides caldifontis]